MKLPPDAAPNSSRRRWLAQAGAAGTSLVALAGSPSAAPAAEPQPAPSAPPAAPTLPVFRYSLNTGTIRGQKLSLPEQVNVTAKAGYHAFEPWLREVQEYADHGGSLADLRKRIADGGLTVESSIAFGDWINDDPAKRAAGLEQCRRDMDLVAQLGGKRMAAPPVGGKFSPMTDLRVIAERYAALLGVGHQAGVVPELEMWGHSKTLSRMSEIAYVLVETGHPDACGLLDIFHIFKGGSPWGGLRQFNGHSLHVVHVNDYPADPPRDKINDSYRVFPGDGVAPLTQAFRDLRDIGFCGFLSLEIFNKEYWKQDALVVAQAGLAKIKAAVAKAGEKP